MPIIYEDDGVPFGWEDALSEVLCGEDVEAFFDAAERGELEDVEAIVEAAYERVYARRFGETMH